MIGAEYAQFTSYIPTENLVPDPGKRFLPSYLLPTFHVPHPWTKIKATAGFQEDFIIVAEFSEIEGPKPVMVIPKNGGENFDQNTFAVKIMAVDHQANSIGFSISEDTQVVLSEDKDGVYAFVHHFVLYDNQARGFVRPFCMAYVTAERRKVMTFYEELSAQFRKVARFLKYGNRMVFVGDLERHLSDLEYTKGQLRMKKTSPPLDPETSEEMKRAAEEETYRYLQNIRASMAEVKDILTVLRPLLNDRRVECRFHTLEERACHQKLKTDYTPTDTISLEENWFSEEKNTATIRCGSFSEGSGSALSLFARKNSYTPKVVSTDRKKKFDSTLRGLHELCSWGAKEGLKKLRCIQEHYKRETMILELERSESNLLDPPGSVMTCGRCLTSNFLTGVSMRGLDLSSSLVNTPLSTPGSEIMKRWPSSDTLDSFKSVGSFISLQDEDEILSMVSADGLSVTPASSQPPSKPTSPINTTTKPVFQRLGSSCDSESTSSVYHTDEASSTADPPRQINHIEISGTASSPKHSTGNTPTTDCDTMFHSTGKDSSVDHVHCNHRTTQGSESEGHTAVGGRQILASRKFSESTSCSECSLSPTHFVQYTDRQAELHCMASPDHPPADVPCETRYMGSSQEDTSGDTQPSTSSGDETGPMSNCSTPSKKPKAGLYSLGDLLEKFGPGVAGYGIVDILSSYNNLQHIIYSLLIGRTVLVVGSPRLEGEVTKMVTALAVFLPDHRRKHPSMVEWLSKPLKLTDLSRIKLAGVCRPEKRALESVVPNVVKKYSSVIDLDRQILIVPKYQGNLVTAILSRRKVFNTDTEFVAFIHCWLMEISSKAFIFYHSFCLGTAGSIMYDYSLQRQKEQYQSTVRSFIAKLGVGDYDTHIVEYLAEVVKVSEIEPHMRQTQDGGGVARPINLNYLPCQIHPLRF